MADTYDVVVISGGPAGEHAAGRLAGAGLQVAIVEREHGWSQNAGAFTQTFGGDDLDAWAIAQGQQHATPAAAAALERRG